MANPANKVVSEELLKRIAVLEENDKIMLAKLTEQRELTDKVLAALKDLKESGVAKSKKAGAAKAVKKIPDDNDAPLDSQNWVKLQLIKNGDQFKKKYLTPAHLQMLKEKLETKEEYKTADQESKGLLEGTFIYNEIVIKCEQGVEPRKSISADYSAYKKGYAGKPKAPTAESSPAGTPVKGAGAKKKGGAKKPPAVVADDDGDDDGADAGDDDDGEQ